MSSSNVSTGLSVNLSTGEVQSGHIQFRNRIINGDMRVNQYGSNAITGTGSSTSFGCVDRFKISYSITTGGLTQNKIILSASDTPYQTGFKYSYRVTASTACSSYLWILPMQVIEDFNAYDFMWGTVYGIPVTLSFWLKTNIAINGNIPITIRNYGYYDYCYNVDISVVSSGNWQYVSLIIPPPPSGSSWYMSASNNGSIEVMIGGYTNVRTSTSNTWININHISTNNSTNIWATLNNYVEFTGVQLEKGTKATPFEFRPYSIELALCQRYVYAITGGGTVGTSIYVGRAICQATNVHLLDIPLPVPMRAIPAIALSANSVLTLYFTVHTGIGTTSITGAQYYSTNQNVARLYISGAGSGSVGYPEEAYIGATTAGKMVLSAEL